MKYLIELFKWIMNLIYKFFKLLRTKNKITFISRQSNNTSIDFRLLSEEIKRQNKDVEIVILNKEIEKKLIKKIAYFFYMFIQMYHIATSKVIILDGYCILISILKHKKDLKVIQLWHALGSLKKFGYSTLNKKEGRNKEIAELMNMHKNYDYILTSSKESMPFFKEAFNAKDSQMLIMSLPRVDYLLSDKYNKKVKNDFYGNYKKCDNSKKNILYCPTHRKNGDVKFKNVIEAVDFKKYNLIIKLHDGQEYIYVDKEKFSEDTKFTGMDLLHVADFIITDYSAIIYEASIVEKPIYFYAYDYLEYMNDRGWYINYKKEMPGPILNDINEIMKLIEKEEWDKQKLVNFKNKYIDDISGNSTKKLTKFILKLIRIIKKGAKK